MENNKTECEESKQDELTQKWIDKLTPDQIIKIMSDQYKFTRKLVEKITSGNSTYDQDISDKLERAESLLQHIAGTLDRISKYQLEKTLDEWKQLKPFLIAELEKPIYKSLDIEQLENGDIPESGNYEMFELLEKALAAAITEMKEQENEDEFQPPSSFEKKEITSIKRPTDKISRAVAFNPFNLEKNGQMHFAEIRTGKKNAEPISVYCCISYKDSDAETIGYVEKHLLEIAYSTARMQGGFVSWQDIYENLGNTGRIKKSTREEWKKRFLKMRHTDIIIHNKGEVGKSKYDYIEINLPFFTSYQIKGKRKGQLIDGICINPEYKPPLFMFAENHGKQITVVPIGVYQVPGLRLTENNARLHDYLISEVAAMINGKITTRITYNTIYEALHINGKSDSNRKARERVDEKIIDILEAFKGCKWIESYSHTISARSDYCIDITLKETDAIEEKEKLEP